MKLKVSSVKDILECPEPEYLIEGVLFKDTATILNSPPGVGKSILSLLMAKSIATGEPFLDMFQINNKGSVLIIDEENPGSILRDRFNKLKISQNMPLQFIHYQGVRLDNDNSFSELLKVVNNVKPILIVFDSLIRLHGCKENDNTEMAIVMDRFRQIMKASHTTLLVIHHDRKGSGDKKERARGGWDIIAAIDYQYCLEEKPDGTLLLSPGKARGRSIESISFEFDKDSLTFTYLGGGVSESKYVIKNVLEVLGAGSMGVEDIKSGLDKKTIKVGINKLRNYLKAADGKEIISKSTDKGKLIYRANSSFTD